MALISCPDCGHKVSDIAPGCVRPVKAVTENLKYDEPILTIDLTDEMNGAWLRARRLLEAACGKELKERVNY